MSIANERFPLFLPRIIDEPLLFLYNCNGGGMLMTISQKIKMALAYKGMSEAELARAVGSSPQAFNQRMKTGKFSSEEMRKIAIALGAEYYFGFRFPDGTTV